MLLVRGYVCVFVLNLFDFKILCLLCYFAIKKIGGPFSGQPDTPEDCQISQLGSPANCQIFWSYFYPCPKASQKCTWPHFACVCMDKLGNNNLYSGVPQLNPTLEARWPARNHG